MGSHVRTAAQAAVHAAVRGTARLGAAAFVAGSLLLASGSALAGDIPVNSQGKAMGNPTAGVPPKAEDFEKSEWEVLEDNLDGITYRIPGVGQAQSLPASSVKIVYFDPANIPADLTKGEFLASRGDFEAARAALDKVQKDTTVAPWARAQAAFVLARTYADASDNAGAEKALAAFKSSFPKSKWVLPATETRARALMALGKIEDAKAEFSSLKTLKGVPEDVAVGADYWLVWIDEKVATARNDKEALKTVLKAYEALISKLGGKSQYETLLRQCQVGRASVMIALGQAPEAKVELEKLARDTKDLRALAAIYNKLGLATWHAAPKDKGELHQALLHFLRVVTLYGDAMGADDDCAEAGFHAGELFKELRDPSNDWGLRAKREWNEVVSRFPGSEWARKSKQAAAER